MYQAWILLLPGFKWITWGSFFLGLIETFFPGIYPALVFVPLYNFFKGKFENADLKTGLIKGGGIRQRTDQNQMGGGGEPINRPSIGGEL